MCSASTSTCFSFGLEKKSEDASQSSRIELGAQARPRLREHFQNPLAASPLSCGCMRAWFLESVGFCVGSDRPGNRVVRWPLVGVRRKRKYMYQAQSVLPWVSQIYGGVLINPSHDAHACSARRASFAKVMGAGDSIGTNLHLWYAGASSRTAGGAVLEKRTLRKTTNTVTTLPNRHQIQKEQVR